MCLLSALYTVYCCFVRQSALINPALLRWSMAGNNYINHYTCVSHCLLFLILYSHVLNNLNPEIIIVSLIDFFFLPLLD